MDLLAQIVELLAPSIPNHEQTRILSVSSTETVLDLSEFMGRVVLLQSDQDVAIALVSESGNEDTAPASLSASQGGVRVPASYPIPHRVTPDACKGRVVAGGSGSLWYAPISRPIE